MRVIATAGHVDHGKSTLVKRLTGIDPDRLAEEKARAMTIDLGFAWLPLPNGEMLGIVDVPGHRDFIANMLAGMGGIDAALLIIAADEGVMPQTLEHLAILDLLGIDHSLIVLTKTDLIRDPAWLELVTADIRQTVSYTQLAQAEIIPVSAHTGAGIPYLLERITATLDLTPPHSGVNQPHLSIDRVFTMSGFGTVVTGTLRDGSLHVGDEIEVQPANLRGRIRGLQSYKQAVAVASPGSRVAVNLAGVDHHALRRGDMLAAVGDIQPTDLIDLHYRHLRNLDRPLKHDAQVKLFVGAAEAVGRVRLLDAEEITPGGTGWLQLHLDRLIAVAPLDRCIIRYPSPAQTIGGGVIVDPHPARRWRRFQPAVLAALETRLHGTPIERIIQAASAPITPLAVAHLLGVGQNDIANAAALGEVITLADGSILSAARWHMLQSMILDEVRTFHVEHPLRSGIPREELRRRLNFSPALLTLYLRQLPDLLSQDSLIKLRDHQVILDYAQQNQADELLRRMDSHTPPTLSEAAQSVSTELVYALIERGAIIQLQPDVILSPAIYAEMMKAVLDLLDLNTSTTVAEVRDRCQTTRKYAIALLEHLDALGVTRRQGDVRVRGEI